MKKIILIVWACSLVACGNFENKQKFSSVLDTINKTGKIDSSAPSCVVAPREYILDSELVSMTLDDSGGISVGFNLANSFLKLIGLGVEFQTARMEIGMDLYETLTPDISVANTTGKGVKTDLKLDFSLGFAQWGIGADWYFKSPLSKLSENTLKKGLDDLQESLEDQRVHWKTKVLYVDHEENLIVVPVGQVAGLRVGDQLAIHSMKYIWKGAPCASDLWVERPSTDPIAIAEIINIEPHAALLSVSYSGDEARVRLGDRAVAHHLPEDNRRDDRELLLPVQIRSTSGALEFENGLKFDMAVYAERQLKSLFRNYGFYPTPLGHN